MCFSHQDDPPTVKLSVSTVRKHFYGIEKNMSFRSKKYISHQNEPHRAILRFSAVLKHFY